MKRHWILIALFVVTLVSRAAEHAFLGVVPDKSVEVAGTSFKGLRISEVVAKGPAAKAGLKSGDVLLTFNGKTLEDGDDLSFFLKKARAGDRVSLEWMRSGARQKGVAVLAPRDKPDVSVKVLGKEFGRSADDAAFLGVGSLAINSELLRHFGVEGGHGILIDQVIKASPAARAGVKVGDVLVNLDGRSVDSPGRLRSLMSSYKAGARVRVELVRNRQLMKVDITLSNRDQSSLELDENQELWDQEALVPELPELSNLPRAVQLNLDRPLAALGSALKQLMQGLPIFNLEN